MNRIYLDNAAGTPLDRRVEKAMRPFGRKMFGNPSALYKEGIAAKQAVEHAREAVAETLGAHTDELVFTGGGTESDNLAVFGVVRAARAVMTGKPHVVTSAIEHPAVLEACRVLEKDGLADVTYVGVTARGVIAPKEVKEALREETALVSVMYSNNEIGTIQPIREIAKVARDRRKETGGIYPYMHTDACQAMNYLDMDALRLGVDLLTINGSKIYGPKGIGALYVKRGTRLAPIIYGGGQEMGLRGGTENVSAIVGFAEAARLSTEMRKEEAFRLTEIRDYFIKELPLIIPGSILNGDPAARLPNNINISIPRIDSEQLVIELDAHGIAASARSACKSRDYESSYVIIAMMEARGREPLPNEGSVRFSLGRETRKRDIDYVLKILPDIIKKIQL